MSNRDLRNLYEGVRRGDEYVPEGDMKGLYVEVLGNITDPHAEPTASIPGPERKTKNDILKLIFDLDKGDLLKQDDIDYISQYLEIKPFRTRVTEYLNNHNLSTDTVVEFDVIEQIINILSTNGDLEKYTDYISKSVKLSSIPRGGILLDVLTKIIPISRESLTSFIELKGTEAGRGVGKAEMACAALFSDCQQGEPGEGDLTWNGEYLEVKGTDARLGKRDREFGNFEETSLGRLSVEHGITSRVLSVIISELMSREKPKIMYSAIDEFIAQAYPHFGVSSSKFSVKSPEDARVFMNLVYFTNYANAHSVKHFMFINTSATRYYSRYIIFKASEITKLLKDRRIGAGVIKLEDLDPSIATI